MSLVIDHIHYGSWNQIKQRCYNPKHARYADYGKRGVALFNDWREDFWLFLEYIQSLPDYGEEGRTLDRIDNDGNYEPGNLRWATKEEQSQNRRLPKLAKNNTSGVKGVSWHKGRNKWRSQLRGKDIGYFSLFEEAVEARLKAEENDK